MSKYNKEELKQLIFDKKLSYEAIGKIYGVTGNAIKKAAKRLNIELKPRRVINSREKFNNNQSKLNKISDIEFIKIINSKTEWSEIRKSLGYLNNINSDIKKKIKERCLRLGISLNLKKMFPILSQTKQQLLTNRKNYQSYRSAIRKHAEKIYKESNKDLKCFICGYDKHVEIAHIKAVSEFTENSLISDINSLDNLVALCPNHHWEYDNNIIKL